jgi:simple sugar transport system ATP-binding protein
LADLAIIPADRHDSGCVLEMTVAENMIMNDLADASHRGILTKRTIDERARELIDEFDIAAPGPHVPMWTLSGGNQQKVVLARELSRSPAFIIAEQPTRGLDVGAMEYMWHRLRQAATAGAGVLLVSTEIDEILALSTRVVVMFRGRIMGEMARGEVDLQRLGLMMGGQAA